MRIRLIIVLGLAGSPVVAGCVDEPEIRAPGDCSTLPLKPGGTSEIGFGPAFSPISDGQDVTLVPSNAPYAYDKFWQIPVNTRVTDMDVGTGERLGVVYFAAFDGDTRISLDVGCRVREFIPTGSNEWEMTNVFLLSMHPTYIPILEGALLRLTVEVHDHTGRQATHERFVTTHLP